jgi:anti-sigma factor RsiW
MKDEGYAPECGRENDLIAFLYGELDASQSSTFRSHIQECRSCATELEEFSGIRDAVVAWRNEALVGVTSTGVQAPAVLSSDVRTPGALTALREFFNLSPLWMKGAVAFASLLFCLFAVLAVARLRETPPTSIAKNPNDKSYSPQELEAAVARRVHAELQKIKESSESTPEAGTIAAQPSDRVLRKRSTHASRAVKDTEQTARRPLSKVERQQLAADLRLIDDPTEVGLELLNDRINQ